MNNSSSSNEETIRILAVGDVVGRAGRRVCTEVLPALRERLQLDLIIVNGENSSGGGGIDPTCAREIRAAGADSFTLGDHTWQRKEARDLLEQNQEWCIRPANYPPGAPGRGWTIKTVRGVSIGVCNLMGRVFIPLSLDCPFQAAKALIEGPLAQAKIRILDMHAEATSEKIAMARYIGSKISLQVGTHTHVTTADEKIFPDGPAYISDLGMTGSEDGVIGMDSTVAIQRFITGMPHAYKIASGIGVLNGVVCAIDSATGRALSISRIRERGTIDGGAE